MNRKYVYPILIVLVTTGLYYLEGYVDKKTEDYPSIDMDNAPMTGDNTFGNMLPSSNGEIVTHAYYTLSYREEYEQAEWVAYELLEKHLTKDQHKRPYFVQDRAVKTESADWRNYKNSGYDKGHLCPAGDRKFTYDAYHETFLTSNISPQDGSFNGGIWNSLEQKTRYWAGRYDDVYVVTGGILKEGLKTIGDERVAVPEAFYKIVFDIRGNDYRAIAFIIPNGKTSGSFYNYMVSIDDIEQKTGIDFFAALPDTIENELERNDDVKNWWK
ncbi:putative endonuclease [unidentified eubacterium SCB49]|nr:putative endonuclease [unidentified eubacterium SCB49]